jgi:AraC-like DNA-binding protein
MHWTFPDRTAYAACVQTTNSRFDGQRRSGVPRAAEEGATVRVGTIAGLPPVLRALGADPAVLMAEVGLDPGALDDPDNEISFALRGRLLAHCAARCNCPHLGLLVGQRAGLQSLGLVGLLVRYSPDVGQALRNLVRNLHLHARGGVIQLEVHGSVAVLSFDTYQPGAEALEQVGDGAVAVMFNILLALCGPQWKPAELRFARSPPDDTAPYRRFFAAPLRFNRSENAVAFPSYWLKQPLPTSDEQLSRLLQQQLDARAASHGEPFPGQVRRVLRTALLSDLGSAGQIAGLLAMHSRTLHRRLAAFGTNFRRLVEESRFDIAGHMLEHSTLTVREIADLLDYADASAFTRAFRRWTGTTPAQWRVARRR